MAAMEREEETEGIEHPQLRKYRGLQAITSYTFTNPCHKIGLDSDHLSEEDATAWVKTVARLRAMRAAGVHFFVREEIRDLYNKIKILDGTSGQEVVIKDLTGREVSYFTKKEGTVSAPWQFDPELELVIGRPAISFNSLSDLSHLNMYTPKYAFSSMTLMHREIPRMKNPALTPPILSAREIRRSFLDMKKQWLESKDYAELRKQEHLLHGLITPVINIVGFGFGTVVHADRRDHRRRTFQHYALLTVRDMMEKIQPIIKVRCYAQDPNYHPVEVEAYGSKDINIKILPDPEGILAVDDATIFMSFNSVASIANIVMDISRPVVLIWDGCLSEEAYEDELDPKGFEVEEPVGLYALKKKYRQYHFDGGFSMGSNVRICTKKGRWDW